MKFHTSPKDAPPSAPSRPRWARRLDRLALLAVGVGGRLLGRPGEPLLSALARQDRRPAADLLGSGPRGRAARGAEAEIAAGRAAWAQGQWAEALHHFGEALALEPEAVWAWHGRGDALQRLGAHADALDAYRRAAALAPEVGLHRGGEANALDALGRSEEAARAWSEALRLDPSLGWMRP